METYYAVNSAVLKHFWDNLHSIYLPEEYVTKEKSKDLSDENFTQDLLTKLNNIDDNANKYIHPKPNITTGTYCLVKVDDNGHIIGVDSPNNLADFGITEVPADILKGTISLDNIPKKAIERCIVVENDAERFNLTTNDVQIGDTVKVLSTMMMYFIIDDSKLDSEDGYEDYKVSKVSNVDWSGILNKPDTFKPSIHTHTKDEVIDFPESIRSPQPLLINDVDYNGSEDKSIDLGKDITDILAVMIGENQTINGVPIFISADYVDEMMGFKITPPIEEFGLYTEDEQGTFISWNDLIDNGLIDVNSGNLISVNSMLHGKLCISDTVMSINAYAFSSCSYLTSIVLPLTITSITQYVFINCDNLISINIPDSVTTIESYAFYRCTSLSNIIIPDSVVTIENCAFRECTSLRTITMPKTITNIGKQAFYKCSSLLNITIPEGIIYIGDSVFSNCTSLTTIDLPSSLSCIGNGVFNNCTNLAYAIIPDSVTYIGEKAFYNCTSASIIISPNTSAIGDNAFYNVDHIYYDGTAYGSPWGAKAIN